MFPAIGLVVLLAMVFGGFAITGGALGPVMEAIPHEMLIIGGAAVGALIIGNSMKELKALGGGLMKVFKGPKYKKQDFLDVIFLVSKLMKMLRTEGPIALEPHVEDPQSSALFADYPRLLADHSLVNLIADTLRLVVVSSGTLDVHAVEDAAIYHVVKQIIIASLHGHPQPLVIEAARSGIAHSNQPGFAEVFDGLRGR